jgi:hypothetical protein
MKEKMELTVDLSLQQFLKSSFNTSHLENTARIFCLQLVVVWKRHEVPQTGVKGNSQNLCPSSA